MPLLVVLLQHMAAVAACFGSTTNTEPAAAELATEEPAAKRQHVSALPTVDLLMQYDNLIMLLSMLPGEAIAVLAKLAVGETVILMTPPLYVLKHLLQGEWGAAE